MAQTPTKRRVPKPKEVAERADRLRDSQLFRSIFRPGSIFRKGYQDSPRNRAYVVMNSVLYHLHPVKVKRHGIKLSYTLCLGGLSFFLFIFLTITGIFLMFFYRPATTGAYKPPREFNWIIGVTLLLVTLLLAFTGYLLPWDQLAIWAVTVGTNMIQNSPVVGKEAGFVLLGGSQIGAQTLVRWYTLHVLALPFVIVIQMSVHFWRVRKDGGISGPL